MGTRQAVFSLEMTRLAGSYNDGYADDLSFVIVPEPREYAAGGGVALLAFGFWRTRVRGRRREA